MFAEVSVVPAGDARLVHFSRRWASHRLITEFMVKLFSEFDSGNPSAAEDLKQSGYRRTHSLTSFSHREFKNTVFEHLKDSLVTGVHNIASRDRQDEVVDRSVKSVAVRNRFAFRVSRLQCGGGCLF